MKIQRKDLYDLIWSKPVTEIANQFKTTGSEIRKICNAHNIPLPENGYWMKLKFGKNIQIIPLDGTTDPFEEIEIVEKSKKNRVITDQESENKTESVIEAYHVPEKLTNPDILIQDAIIELKKREWSSSEDHMTTLFDSIKIKATKKLFNRALIFMDTLVKLFRKNGYGIEIKNRETLIIIRGEKIPISCRETIKRIQVPTTYGQQSQDSPTGLLCFQMAGFRPKQWIDGKKMLEDQISSILEKLEAEAERLQLWHIEIEEYWKKKHEEEHIEKEKEELKQKDLQNFGALIKASDRFQKVKQMREYVDGVEMKLKESDETNEKLKEWIEWARKKADWYDPIVNYNDPFFESIDKDTLKGNI